MRLPNPTPEPDAFTRLARRLVQLEPEAYQEFATVFGPKFFRMFVRHGLTVTQAEDLAASCVTDIALKAGKYRAGAGSFSSWVFAIARHAFADYVKGLTRESTAVADSQFGEPWERPDDPADALVTREVISALAELTDVDRTLVQRRALGPEHTFRELGSELGISEGAARVRYMRAMEKLQLRLAGAPAVQARLRKNTDD